MADGRKNNGGKRPNAGRKSKAEELGVAVLMDDRLPHEKRGKIIDNLYKIAVGDNAKAAVSAATILLAYCYGKPTEKVELGHSGTVRVEYVNDWRGQPDVK